MTKVISNFKQSPKNLLITFLLLSSFNTFFAQNVTISYGEKINLGHVGRSTHFYISGNSKELHLKGTEINDHVFDKPGDYHVKVVNKKWHKGDDCADLHLPDEITVKVSPVKMSFDAQKLSFSTPLVKNKQTKGTTLTIPVTIETFDHRPAPLNFSQVSSAGIGTTVTADLQSERTELPEGVHLLTYSLNGIATENSYLMFDFVDANARIQSVSLLTPVKN
jgi:hypothetical protein